PSGNAFLAHSPEAFTYDFDGNLTSDGRWTYTWDAENRLVRMDRINSVAPPQRIAFEYDATGRRIRKQVFTSLPGNPSLDFTYVYDGWNLLAELDSSHNTLRT